MIMDWRPGRGMYQRRMTGVGRGAWARTTAGVQRSGRYRPPQPMLTSTIASSPAAMGQVRAIAPRKARHSHRGLITLTIARISRLSALTGGSHARILCDCGGRIAAFSKTRMRTLADHLLLAVVVLAVGCAQREA